MRKLGAALLALPVILLVLYGVTLVLARSHAPGPAVLGRPCRVVALGVVRGSRAHAPHRWRFRLRAPPRRRRAPGPDPDGAPADGTVRRSGFDVRDGRRLGRRRTALSTPSRRCRSGGTPAGRTLTIAPVGHWTPDTLYTITIDAAARAADGAALASPGPSRRPDRRRGRGAGSARARRRARCARVDATFLVHLDRAVPTAAAVEAALRTSPDLVGTMSAAPPPATSSSRPRPPLAAGTAYTGLARRASRTRTASRSRHGARARRPHRQGARHRPVPAPARDDGGTVPTAGLRPVHGADEPRHDRRPPSR